MGPRYARKIASVYANNNFNIIRAKVEIARRTYYKQALVARVAKMHLLKMERALDKAAHDTAWFLVRADAVSDIDDPEWAEAGTEWVDARAEHVDPQLVRDFGNTPFDSSYRVHPLILVHLDMA